MSLSRSLIRGTLLNGLGRYSDRVVLFVVTIALSRLLSPVDFGLVAMVLAVTSFGGMLSEAGIGSAIIQKGSLTKAECDTAFWLSAVLGLSLMLVTLGFAPLFGTLYGDSRVVPVARVLSLSFLLVGVLTVPLALLKKSHRFGTIAIIDAAGAVVAGVVGITVALREGGYWSIVAMALVRTAGKTLGALVATDWSPSMTLRVREAGSIVSYSGFVIGANIVNYWSRRADDVMVGRVLGAEQLGYYEHAYTLMMAPLRALTGVVQPVLHPVLVRLKDDVEKLRNALCRILEAIGLVSFPLAVSLAIVSEPLVLTVWGPQWQETVPVFTVLAVFAALQPLVSLLSPMYLIRERTKLMATVSAVNMVVLVLAFYVGLSHGIVGVATGFGVGYAVVVVPLTIYIVVFQLLEGSIVSLVRIFRRPLEAAGVVGGLSWLCYSNISPTSTEYVQLGLTGAVGASTLACYLGARSRDVIATLQQYAWEHVKGE